jgi:hypothetical protein
MMPNDHAIYNCSTSAPFLKYGIQRNAADAVGASVDDPKPTVSPEG